MRQIRVVIAAVVFSALIVSCDATGAGGVSSEVDNSDEMVFTEDEAQEGEEMDFSQDAGQEGAGASGQESEDAEEEGLEFSEEEAEAESLSQEFLEWVDGVPIWEIHYDDGRMICEEGTLINAPPEVEIEQGYLFFLEGGQKLQVEGLGPGTVTLERTLLGVEGAIYEGTRDVGGLTQTLEIYFNKGATWVDGSISATLEGCDITRPFSMWPLD